MTYCDTLISKFKLKRHSKVNADIIICDRWINDIIIDLAVDTRQSDLLSNHWYDKFTALLPEDCQQYIIMRNFKDVMNVRPEYVNDREFSFRFKLYNRIVNKHENLIKMDNNTSLQDAVDSILNSDNSMN